MARRRGRDRVVGGSSAPGGPWTGLAQLPRGTYRDSEARSGTLRRDQSVYRLGADRWDSPVGPANFKLRLRSVAASGARHGLMPRKSSPYAKQVLRFLSWLPEVHIPSRVAFCVRRKQRREVLFALKRAGYSGSARKGHWRRTAYSKYRC